VNEHPASCVDPGVQPLSGPEKDEIPGLQIMQLHPTSSAEKSGRGARQFDPMLKICPVDKARAVKAFIRRRTAVFIPTADLSSSGLRYVAAGGIRGCKIRFFRPGGIATRAATHQDRKKQDG
jgi:hypothetical protein